MMNPFLRPVTEYKRDLNLRSATAEQVAKYVSLRLNKPFKEIYPLVVKEMNAGGPLSIADRPMEYLQRKGAGEREVREISFLKYLDLAIETGRILSPSLVVYQTAEENKSVTAEWLDENIALRKRSKSQMFVYKQMGDMVRMQLSDYDQNAKKIRINSVSGMRGFSGCPLFIRTGHSSLTTLCRAAAGYGNGTVERFLGGARHYHTPEIAKANLVAVLTIEDQSNWSTVMYKYGINYPTVDQVMAMVERASKPYWESERDMEIIRSIVSNMTALERAVVTYSGDMYHLALYNETVVKQFIGDMILLDMDRSEVDAKSALKELDGTESAYIYALNSEILRGTTLDKVMENNPEGYVQIGQTARQLKSTLAKYADFIDCFFVPKHLPPTVGNIRDINRTTGIIADTDSSIFTTQWWVKWVTGHVRRGEIEDRVWYMATYAVCQCVAHSLAMLSANVGVEEKFTTRLSMKNEYGFPVLMNTNMSKCYAALVSIREGNVYDEYDLDMKGVGIRGSAAPKLILEGVRGLIDSTLKAIDRGDKLVAYDLIRQVAEYELQVIRSVQKGEYDYLRSDQIKPDGIKMAHYNLWQEVFGPKYGMSAEPPLPVVKVSLELNNKTDLVEWVDGLKDRELADRLQTWIVKNNKKDLKTILLPYQVIQGCGMPEEVQQVANLKKVAYDTCSGFYLVLEACGLFIVDRNYHRLAYEFLEMTP